jgi:hypothetical protein
VEILFMDESRIRMAPNTTLEITEYLYQPEKKKRKGLLSLWAGKARFIVNDLVDFAQKDFEVRTQAGIAGTRGTDFVMELKARKSEKIRALGKHRFDFQQKIEKLVKQNRFPSWIVNAQFVTNDPVNISHEGLLVYATGEDISSEKPQTSTTLKLAQGEECDPEGEAIVRVMTGEVFVCPRRADCTIDYEACVTVIGGEYVIVGIGEVSNPIPIEDQPEPAPEPTPPEAPTPELPPADPEQFEPERPKASPEST